jgi:stress-induced morphogen
MTQHATSPVIVRQYQGHGMSSMGVVRSMSSSGDTDSGTTIVDICTQKIREALDATDVQVQGAYDDPNGSHISIQVVSAKFEGKRAVQRQQLVYKAIWEELQGPVHAVDSMICKTPGEA